MTILASGTDAVKALAALILIRGVCDEGAIGRTHRIAPETNSHLDLVL